MRPLLLLASTLRTAMTRRGVIQRSLAARLGVGDSTVAGWLTGAVPSLRYSRPLAEALDWPSLADLVREARTTPCPVCGRLKVHGSNVGRYCGDRCRNVANARRQRDIEGKPGVLAQHRVKVYDEAVDELCRRWCEPEGLCRDGTCPIQKAGLSPLPLAKARPAAVGGR